MAVHDRGGDVDELPIGGARLLTQHVERRFLADRMAFHQDPLGALRDGSTAEGAFEIVILGEAPQHDVDRALPVLGVGVGDIGEDAALRGLFDEARIGAWMSRITGQAAS